MFWRTKTYRQLAILLALLPSATSSDVAQAQSPEINRETQTSPHEPSMSGMDMGHVSVSPFIEQIEQHATSGTSAEPNSTPTPMLMTTKHGWMLMFHGVGFLNVQQQSGPRGA